MLFVVWWVVFDVDVMLTFFYRFNGRSDVALCLVVAVSKGMYYAIFLCDYMMLKVVYYSESFGIRVYLL